MRSLTKTFGLQPFLVCLMACLVFPLSSCQDDEKVTPPAPVTPQGVSFPAAGNMTLVFSHEFNGAPFLFEPQTYITGPGDTIRASELLYYVSNVSLMKADGSYLNLGGYRLVDYLRAGSEVFTIPGVPAGTYKTLRFCIGVDSLNNHSGAQTGDLDPGYGMIWNWTTGYIFLKLSGRFNNNRAYSFHLGGDQHLTTVEIDLTDRQVVSQNPRLSVVMDIRNFFSSPNPYPLTGNPTHVHDPNGPTIPMLSQNISTMFAVKSVTP